MIINIKDTLILDDDNEYIIISKVFYNNIYYYYLLNKKNNNEKFCYQEKDELVELTDKNLTTTLLPLFLEETKKEVN